MTRIAVLGCLPDLRYMGKNGWSVSVAIQTRSHGELRHLGDHLHALHVAMATDALDPPVYMDAVVEVGIVGHFVDPFPRHGGSLFEVAREFDDRGPILACYGVTIHTGRRGGNPRVSRGRNAGMAVVAFNTHRTGMESVGEGNRLFGCIPYPVAFSPGEIVGGDETRGCHKDDKRKPDLQGVIEE